MLLESHALSLVNLFCCGYGTVLIETWRLNQVGHLARQEKAELLARGKQPNPFIDGRGYKRFIKQTEKAFREQLAKERHAVTKKVV